MIINEQVLKAFVHGDENLLNNYPELQDALVWVYFHSNIQEFNKVECWGPLKDASSPSSNKGNIGNNIWSMPQPCQDNCNCCFPPISLIPWSQNNDNDNGSNNNGNNREEGQALQQHQL